MKVKAGSRKARAKGSASDAPRRSWTLRQYRDFALGGFL
jgi:hypothetical protein